MAGSLTRDPRGPHFCAPLASCAVSRRKLEPGVFCAPIRWYRWYAARDIQKGTLTISFCTHHVAAGWDCPLLWRDASACLVPGWCAPFVSQAAGIFYAHFGHTI